MPEDVYGQALLDYHNGTFEPPLLIHNNYGEPEEMPVEVFFREPDDLSDMENYAIELCDGVVLDVGAGAGVHTLILQDMHHTVALDSSKKACKVMSQRGVKNIVHCDLLKYRPDRKYDTILMLMNGTGILGTLRAFKNFLTFARTLLAENGRIIIDSSDIEYLYEEGEYPDYYYGQVEYQFEYKQEQGELFKWLYIDQDTLQRVAAEVGWATYVVFEGEEDEYLAVLQPFS
ncbi:class I SAM-dependent methyltransferase [Fulvivirga sediminis]|uniref:Class I SAM-dependent methyltransferase n=1 Tax=Fulvivirga sediminis TaxID=2803949 RepID=A0A937F6S3_9BACT|nr:class I SAM-dependent methyltransferase [Fulvivirga sediminis]MBL3656062.1 class I SAM-dependent methyltransferase [Fulvivirga sediminis]